MKAPPKRKRHAVSDVAPRTLLQQQAGKATPEAPPAQAVIEKLQTVLRELDNTPLPVGDLGASSLMRWNCVIKSARRFAKKRGRFYSGSPKQSLAGESTKS